MKSLRLFRSVTLCLLLATASCTLFEKKPEQADFQIFLLAGQSNMAGRGAVAEQDKEIHPRVFALSKEGVWKPAVAPIHYDKKWAGTGLGKSFAVALAEENPDIIVGLVPAACGGSPIESWQPGGYHKQTKSHPYDDAVARSKRAMENGTLKAILWHQGESDCTSEKAQVYKEKLIQMIARFRRDFKNPKLPVIIGQLGRFPEKPWSDAKKTVDRAHREIADVMPFVAFVPSEGLACKKDNVHFDSPSLRAFGKRYAEAYLELTRRSGRAASASEARTAARFSSQPAPVFIHSVCRLKK